MADDDGASTRFEMRASPAWMKALDDWRRQQDDLPSRAEAIRRLVDMGMSGASALLGVFEAESAPELRTQFYFAAGALLPGYDAEAAIDRLVSGTASTK